MTFLSQMLGLDGSLVFLVSAHPPFLLLHTLFHLCLKRRSRFISTYHVSHKRGDRDATDANFAPATSLVETRNQGFVQNNM